MRKTWLTVALAAVTALAAVGGAHAADIVESEPSGEITMTSLGRIVFNVEFVRIDCRLTLRGRYYTTGARGSLTGSLTAKPQIGEITGATVAECPANTEVRILFEPLLAPTLLFTNGISEPNSYNLNLRNFTFLIRAGIVFACLYNVLLPLSYDGDLLTIGTPAAGGATTRLSGTCPLAPPAMSGVFDLSPDQELILRSEI